MKRKFFVEPDSGVKMGKRNALRDALLPLVNSGSAPKRDMIFCAYRKKHDTRTMFITQKQYQQLKAEYSTEE